MKTLIAWHMHNPAEQLQMLNINQIHRARNIKQSKLLASIIPQSPALCVMIGIAAY
jgi:hypothetical protein